MQFSGTDDAKIYLLGLGSQSWQGIVTLNSNYPSNWSNVVIKSTAGMSLNGWNLTGGITFYKSDVNIKDSIIEDSRGEDAINIVHANFTLKNVSMRKTVSDALIQIFRLVRLLEVYIRILGSQEVAMPLMSAVVKFQLKTLTL